MENNNADRKTLITVFSPKGGVGTTTITVNLAISLHKLLKEDILIVDGKHLFGHVALYCNLRTSNSINDLIAHAGSLDARLVKQVVIKHNSGVYVLPSPTSIIEGQGIQPKELFKVLQSLKQVFPFIIVDGGNNLNENSVTYMDTSDKVLLVLQSDLASIRDTRQFLDLAAAVLSYPKEKIQLIVNSSGRKENIKNEEIENILKSKIFGEVPSDADLALSCINEGIPLIMKKPRHPITRAIDEISSKIIKLLDELKIDK
jgi:pilus assembly protein CpaE